MSTCDTAFYPLQERPNARHDWYSIRPEDITDMKGTFGKHEVEASAERILVFFKERGYWCECSLDELTRFFDRLGWNPDSMFFGLLGGWYNDGGMGHWEVPRHTYFIFDKRGGCAVTNHFVDVCGKNVKRRAA